MIFTHDMSIDDYAEAINQPEPEDTICGIPVSEIDRAYERMEG